MYDYHMHTTFSDGKNTIKEMVETAKKLGLSEIAITDHVWKSTKWFDEYRNEIKQNNSDSISIKVGFEAKALSLKGEIDATDDMILKSDIRLGAIHRIPKSEGYELYLTREEVYENKQEAYDNWLQTSKALLMNKDVDVLAHPFMALNKYKISPLEKDVILLFNIAKEFNKKLEISFRYKKSNDLILKTLYNYPSLLLNISYGSDAHSSLELVKAHRFM